MSDLDRLSPNLKGRFPMKGAVLLEPDKDTEVWEVSSVSGVKSYWKAQPLAPETPCYWLADRTHIR